MKSISGVEGIATALGNKPSEDNKLNLNKIVKTFVCMKNSTMLYIIENGP